MTSTAKETTRRLRLAVLASAVAAGALVLAGCLGEDTGEPPEVDAGGPYTMKINSELVLQGSATDPDDDLVKAEWDINNDGVYDFEFTSGFSMIEATTSFTAPGTYTATLRATDDKGNETTDTAQITVDTGESPVADAGGPYSTPIYVMVTLTGSGTDADGNVTEYAWDLDNGSFAGCTYP